MMIVPSLSVILGRKKLSLILGNNFQNKHQTILKHIIWPMVILVLSVFFLIYNLTLTIEKISGKTKGSGGH